MKRKSLLQKKKMRAQSLVEFALVLPLLLLVIYGLLEVGRLIFTYSIVISASREAVRYGSATGLNVAGGVARYKDCAGIRAAAQNVDFLGVIDDANITIVYDKGPGGASLGGCPPASVVTGDRITVNVAAPFATIIPLPIGPITAHSFSARTIIVSLAVAGTALPPPTVPPPPPPPTKILNLTGNLSFGNVVVNTISTKSLIITNAGNTTLTVSSITLPSGFSADWTSGTISAGNSVTITISFSPTTTSTYSGMVTINSDMTSGTSATPISGTGYISIPTITPNGSETPTPSLAPTLTFTPSLVPTITYTPSPTPTAVNCLLVTHGPLRRSGNTLSMDISNMTGATLNIAQILTTWNSGNGHISGDTTLRLQNIAIGGSPIWGGDSAGPSWVSSFLYASGVTLPSGASNIVFTFHQSYDKLSSTDKITIQFYNNGCTSYTLDSSAAASCNIAGVGSINDLTGTRGNGSSGTLTWTPNVEDLGGVNVYTSLDNVNWTLVNATPLPPSTGTYGVSVSGKNGDNNYFRIRPVNSCSNAPYSNTVIIVK